MRFAPAFIVLTALAAAGCGGTAKPVPVSNTVEPPAKQPWTLDRVLETLKPEVSIVAYIDVDRVKTNEIVTGYIDEIVGSFKDKWPAACDQLEPPHSVLIAGDLTPGAREGTIWGLGLPAAAWMKCLEASKQISPAAIMVDGDYATMTSDRTHAAYLVLDDETLISVFGPRTLTRAELEARTAANDGSAGLREALAIRTTAAPIWAIGRGSSPAFATLPMPFRTGSMTIDLSDHVDVDVNVGMATDQATMIANAIQQKGQMALAMGFVTALDAHTAGEALVVHAELTKASIDKMISTIRAFGGGGGMGPFGPGGPGPTPTP